MADEKTVNLRVDGSQGEQALDGIERAAEGASEAMGGLAVEIEKTETQTKRLAGTSRDYNNAARSVGDSVQAITRFEAAYRASLNDSANSAQVRAQILAASFARTIGGAADEARAAQLLAAGHEKAATAVQFIVQQQALLAAETQAVSQVDTVAAAVAASNAAIRVNAIQKAADAARQAARDQSLSYLDGASPSGGKSAGASAGVFAAAFREEEAAATASALALVNRERALNENIRITAQWEAMLEGEARAARDAAAAEAQLVQRTQSLVATYAPHIAQSQTLSAHEAQLNSLRASGAITVEHHTAALAGLRNQQTRNTAEMERMAGGTRMSGYALQNLSYQVNDVITQLASGTPPMQVFAQQGGQIFQVFQQAGIGLGSYAAAAAAIAVPVTVAGALIWELGKKGREATESLKVFADAEKNIQAVLERSNDITKEAIALAREKAGATRDSAAASLKEQEAIANAAFAAAGQKLAASQGRDAKIGPGYVSVETQQADNDLEKIFTTLQEITQAKRDLQTQPPLRIADTVLTSGQSKAELEDKRTSLQTGITEAAARGDTIALTRLTEAYGAVNRAIATYVTDGQRAVLTAEAQAKASTMGAVEGQRYLAQRQAEIGLMGKVIEQGEAERTIAAARIESNAAATKSYVEAQKTVSAAAIEMKANLALNGLDGERAALSQRRQLGEISAAEELAQAIGIADRKRAVQVSTAQQNLALMRSTAGAERAEIDAAERSITELRAKHSLDRQKQVDEEAAHRKAMAKQMAEIDAEGAAARGNSSIAAKTENVGFQKSMGQIDSSEEIAALRAIADEKYQIERDLLDKKLQMAGIEEAERARVNQQMIALDERRAAEMTRLDHQASLNRLAEIRSYTEPFTSATTMMTQGFIQGTLTRQQLAQRAAQSIAISYANMGAKVVTDWFNTHVAMAAWDRLFGAQQVAQTAVTQAGVTGAKAVGTAAQTGVVVAGQTTEAGAVVAGEAVKNAAQTAGASQGLLVKSGAAIKSVAISAWEAAAGAYAAIASIPYVGPVMAPIAAAGALAAVFAIGRNIASAEGGWGEVPEDGSPAVLHKKEMVLPAQFAVPLRAMLTDGGGAAPRYGLPAFLGRQIGSGATTTRPGADSATAAGSSPSFTYNVTAVDAAGVQAFFNTHARTLSATVARHFSDNPSTRPAY